MEAKQLLDDPITLVTVAFAKAALELSRLGREKITVASQDYPLVPPFSNMTRTQWVDAVALWLNRGPGLVANLPERPCPACGGGKHRKLFDSYDGYPFCECDDCRTWFVPKRVDMALFESFFDEVPDARELAEQMLRGRLAAISEKADRDRIGGYLDELVLLAADRVSGTLRYLDTGCGVGNSLLAAQERGIEAVGIESDDIALSLARSRGHMVRHISESLPDGEFDFISFWESLEHISDPLEALKRYSQCLRSNGVVAITVPNLDSAIVRVMKGDCPYVHGGTNSPGHINLFGLRGINRLLDRADLVVLDADVQYSNNAIDLFTYLFGQSRGAADMLNAGPEGLSIPLPDVALKVLNSIWPAVNIVERILLTGPILRIIACRRGVEHDFSRQIKDLQDRRKKTIAKDADYILQFHPDI